MEYHATFDYGSYGADKDSCLYGVYYHDDTVGFKETLLVALFRWEFSATDYIKAQKKGPEDEYWIRRIPIHLVKKG